MTLEQILSTLDSLDINYDFGHYYQNNVELETVWINIYEQVLDFNDGEITK